MELKIVYFWLICFSQVKLDASKEIETTCNGIKCAATHVCEEGLCVSEYDSYKLCGNIICPIGSICESSKCVDKILPCINEACPVGRICKDGDCVFQMRGLCDGVVCLDGAKCVEGACFDWTLNGDISEDSDMAY